MNIEQKNDDTKMISISVDGSERGASYVKHLNLDDLLKSR